jgi:PAS domain S-box-containing protein
MIERTLVAKDGRRIPVEVNFHLITYEGKKAVLSISRDVSERKAVEAALHVSEEKFFKIFHANPLPMSISSLPDGKYLDVNKEFERVSGWSAREAKGRTTGELNMWVHPEDFYVITERLSKENSLRGFELALRSRAGDIFTFLWSAEVMVLGGRRCIITSAYDITDRKRMEDALRESEEKFCTFIEQNSVGFILVDKEGKIIEWNCELERISGISRRKALGKDYWEVQHQVALKDRRTPQLRERMKTLLHSALTDVTVMKHSFEARLCRPDGAIVHIHQSVFPVKTKSGYLLGSVIRDITEKKNSEEALRDSEQRFKTLIENAFEGITVVDRNFKVKYESPGLNRILGYSTEERYGTGAFDSVHPDDAAQAQEAFGRAMAHPDEIFQMILRIKHKDGAWRWIECIGKNLLDDATISGIVINYRDITERKQAEEAQQKLEQQIQQVEKLESIGILAGGIAHDFNNLLTGIFGYIDVARLYNSSGASDKVTMNLSKALDVFNRARALTQQLLTFSKGGSPVKKTLSLSPLLTSTANFVLSGSNVSARFSFSNGLWPCEVDENQLGQVIDNIIINARQAMPTGGSIVVTAENIPESQPVPAPLVPGSYVRISIRDFGTGISKEHLPHIFDPFFTTKQEGSGLGLATAYSIIRKHGGIIEAESELGIGSTFRIYLPALPSAAAESLSTGIKKHRGQGVVLVMDDEEFIRDVAMELVKTMGYSAEPAKNGEEAVAKYKKAFSSPAPYALVILDLTVPGGMGGKDTVQELLKINPSVAAIASSGYSHDPVMTDPQAFGFKDKIRKPFTKEELGEVLERVTGTLK